MPFMAVKKSRKRFAFVISSLETVHLQQQERMLSCERGTTDWSIKGIRKVYDRGTFPGGRYLG